MKVNISNIELQELLSGRKYIYPKYTTQIMNLANQNAQGTRPRIVGQMSELINEFTGTTLQDWEKWYLEGHPDAINNAADKVWPMITALKESIQTIDYDMVKKWIEELVVVKTFAGLKFQEAILKKVAGLIKKPYYNAKPSDESKGVDGFINGLPVSIKPETYKTKMALNERITVPIIYYKKSKSALTIEFDPNDFN